MTQRFNVWYPDDGEDQSDGREWAAYDFEDAANEYIESLWHEDPFDGPVIVMVASAAGEVKKFRVHPEPTMTFNAYEYVL